MLPGCLPTCPPPTARPLALFLLTVQRAPTDLQTCPLASSKQVKKPQPPAVTQSLPSAAQLLPAGQSLSEPQRRQSRGLPGSAKLS